MRRRTSKRILICGLIALFSGTTTFRATGTKTMTTSKTHHDMLRRRVLISNDDGAAQSDSTYNAHHDTEAGIGDSQIRTSNRQPHDQLHILPSTQEGFRLLQSEASDPVDEDGGDESTNPFINADVDLSSESKINDNIGDGNNDNGQDQEKGNITNGEEPTQTENAEDSIANDEKVASLGEGSSSSSKESEHSVANGGNTSIESAVNHVDVGKPSEETQNAEGEGAGDATSKESDVDTTNPQDEGLSVSEEEQVLLPPPPIPSQQEEVAAFSEQGEEETPSNEKSEVDGGGDSDTDESNNTESQSTESNGTESGTIEGEGEEDNDEDSKNADQEESSATSEKEEKKEDTSTEDKGDDSKSADKDAPKDEEDKTGEGGADPKDSGNSDNDKSDDKGDGKDQNKSDNEKNGSDSKDPSSNEDEAAKTKPPIPPGKEARPPDEPPKKHDDVDEDKEKPAPSKDEEEKAKEEEDEIRIELIEEEAEFRRLSGLGIFLAILAMIFTAWQMSENPDGIYAAACRLIITVFSLVVRLVLAPCRGCLGGGNRYGQHGGIGHIQTSRHTYGQIPSTMDYGYRDPALELS